MSLFQLTDEYNATFCDWRFAVANCTDSEFFVAVQAFSAASQAFQAVVCIVCLFLRAVVLKDDPKTFRFGVNGALIVLLITVSFYLAQNLLVLDGQFLVASSVTWAICSPLALFGGVFYLGTILEAFPEIFVERGQVALKTMTSSARVRRLVLSIFFLYMLSLHAALFLTAFFLRKQGQVDEGNRLAQAGMMVFAVNMVIFLFLFVYVARMFLGLILEGLRNMARIAKSQENKNPHEKERHDILLVVTGKIKKTVVVMSVHGGILSIYHVLLAFYPRFFINLEFSKTMAVLMVAIIPSLSIFLVLVYLYTDIRRIIYQNHVLSKYTSSAKSQPRELDLHPITGPTVEIEQDPSVGDGLAKVATQEKATESALDDFLQNTSSKGSRKSEQL